MFLNLYRVELRREHWCIKYLDIDPEKAIENLDEEIEDYQSIKKEMETLNKTYKNSVMICGGSVILNTIFSLYDLSTHWAGSSSLTPLLSSILLIFMKIYNSYFVSNASLIKERAYSAYISGPKTYNTIDSDYIKGDLHITPEVSIDDVLVNVESKKIERSLSTPMPSKM